jgi:hypothetical protein
VLPCPAISWDVLETLTLFIVWPRVHAHDNSRVRLPFFHGDAIPSLGFHGLLTGMGSGEQLGVELHKRKTAQHELPHRGQGSTGSGKPISP